MKRGCLSAVAALFLGALGLFAYTQLSAPRVDSVPLSQLPPEEQKVRRQEARQLEDQVSNIARAARAGEKKPFVLEVTDEQLNTLLQDRVDLSKFPIRDLRVGFEPGRVVAQGEVKYSGVSATATLVGNVTLENGQLIYITDSLQVMGVPAPAEWKEKLDKEVTKQLNVALKKAPGRVDEVRLESGKMIVSGQTD